MNTEYLAQFLNTLTPNTREVYSRGIRLFCAFSEVCTRGALQAFTEYTAQQTSAQTANTYLAAVKSFVRWQANHELLDEPALLVLSVRALKTKKSLPKLVRDFDDVLCSFDPRSLEGSRALAILTLLYESGLRVAELVSLNWKDLDFDRQEAVVLGKGQKERVVFFTERSLSALANYASVWEVSTTEGPVFLNQHRRRLTDRSVQLVCEAHGFNPHALRHTLATAMLEVTGDLDAVRQVLGHSDIRTTQRYTATATKRVRSQYERTFERNTNGGPRWQEGKGTLAIRTREGAFQRR